MAMTNQLEWDFEEAQWFATKGRFFAHLHPGKLTWNPKMEVWKMIFPFNWVILRFHVNSPGCII